MPSNISDTHQSTAAAPKTYTTGSVISQDGTTIGYRQYGHGPGIVLVQGTMGTAQNFNDLAELLSDTFTVYVSDRRGRGLSPLPYHQDYTVQRDVEDLEALLTKTGAHQVFGLSSGAIITLQAALTLPAMRKVAIYEPPLLIKDPAAFVARFNQHMAQGNVAAALVTAMKAAQMGPALFNYLPNWLLVRLTNMMMAGEEKNLQSEYVTMRALAPTLYYDSQVIVETHGKLEGFKAIRADVLLLGGSKSPTYLKQGLDALEKVLPQARRIEFPGLGHAASWNYEKQRNPDGKPEVVAKALASFFAEPQNP